MKKIIAVTCLLLVSVMLLASCGPNFKNMEKKLEDKGYSVFNLSKEDLAKDDDDDNIIVAALKESLNEQLEDISVSNILIAVKIDLTNLLSGDSQMVMVVKLDKTDDAKKLEEDLKNDNSDDSDYVVKRSGKVVYAGTNDAVKLVK